MKEYHSRPEVKTHKNEYQKLYKELNMENFREYHKNYVMNRYNTDINFRLSMNLRGRLNKALQGNSKSDHTMNLIGCDLDFFKTWISFQFYDNCEWNNYGFWWHLEHVKACCSFNLEDPEEQRKCFNWKNLTCLRADKNIIKGGRRDMFAELMQELRVKVFLKLGIPN